MPYIDITTTKVATEAEAADLKARLGELISIFPGKSEAWLMIALRDGCKMAFRGTTDKDTAMVEVKLFGKAAKGACDEFTKAACAALNEVLKIPTDRIYIKYEECFLWGYDGENF